MTKYYDKFSPEDKAKAFDKLASKYYDYNMGKTLGIMRQ
jgi:hypothetical protein